LPRAVASDLAAKSDAIADALGLGDVCTAAGLADQLKDAVDAAVSGGQVPPAYQDELEQTATDLQNEVNCEEKKHEDRGKKKGHDGDDETTTLGTTVYTTTEESD
jgi:HPt (histidine-containing phosphotransfer) domain-containing protein